MTWKIRRLGAGDEAVLTMLAREDADFDLAGRGRPRRALADAEARQFLANPAVLLWAASAGETVVGFLLCLVLPLRSNAGRELMLYEIGVRERWRRRGVGRSLLAEMETWMRANGVADAWVLADNDGAAEFYAACGYRRGPERADYFVRELP